MRLKGGIRTSASVAVECEKAEADAKGRGGSKGDGKKRFECVPWEVVHAIYPCTRI